ncbi:hypothetical protein [Mycolicibacterium chlorophenolicum]|uniref:ABM domain-containing protein n=1 Tax=Mycolicibacterium chlorophenolicum TaxID=37916 RepID=A0A0J6VB40_9MYCO|nr:hypothetical protein [Mycolicibacterium chlorophenolicum]KMO66962.1 hypothetical protein MCHLDSM_07306 [Mycolicibacterium chlorophenolicum]
MRAVLRLNTFDADKLAAASEQLEEFDRLHAVQPGYLGNVTVDVGQGRRFVINLWETAEHQQAGLKALGPAVEHLVNPLLAVPSQLIAEGTVIRCDLIAPDTT